MEVEVGIALFNSTKVALVVFGCVLPENLTKVDKKSLFRAIFTKYYSKL